LAPDGGLYVPSEYPTVTKEELLSLHKSPYTDIAKLVKSKLVGDAIPEGTLDTIIDEAYGSEVFGGIEDGAVTPLVPIGEGLFLENLSLGPTAAFKDMAMQPLGREMDYELERRNESLTILGATSGDTGSAAEAAFKGLARVTLVMLSPEEGMSDFQKAQMGSFSGGNIHNISVRGRFDDCQDLVKAVKQDAEFSKLGAVNSINWGRISSQVPYYFSGYLAAVDTIGDPVDFVVPSGNFGNVLSGYIAKQMGLPIRRLIVATNENSVLHHLFSTGEYKLSLAEITSSPSMDISKASNYERLAFDLLGRDPEKTSAYMNVFNDKGVVDIRDFGLNASIFKALGFESGSSSHEKRLIEIKKVYEDCGEIIDPHTADGVSVAREFFDTKEGVPMVSMMTALPVKFEHTIEEALGFVPKRPEHFENIEKNISPDNFVTIDSDAEALKNYIRTRM